jgi:hypothetical protein
MPRLCKKCEFFTFLKTKSEFVFFGKDLEKKANSDFVENRAFHLIRFKNKEKTRKNYEKLIMTCIDLNLIPP